MYIIISNLRAIQITCMAAMMTNNLHICCYTSQCKSVMCGNQILTKYSLFLSEGLQKAIEKAYTPSIDVKRVQWIHDIKTWLSPHMWDLHGHTGPLSFKFTLNGQGKASMYFRHWCTDGWSDEALIILKVSTVQ